ncbi:MAG: hypothetical protein ACLFQX_04030 [Candidatus Kapaibacterium sp.]
MIDRTEYARRIQKARRDADALQRLIIDARTKIYNIQREIRIAEEAYIKEGNALESRLPRAIAEAGKYYGITYSALRSKSSMREVRMVRYSIFKFMKDKCRISNDEIGRYFSRKAQQVKNGIARITDEAKIYDDARRILSDVFEIMSRELNADAGNLKGGSQ